MLVTPQRLPNPELVGRPATYIAAAGRASRVPPARACSSRSSQGVGRDYPLSIEKLCPVLSFYVVNDWREGCERCKQILRYGGMGHTMSIHSRNDDVILQFGLKKPAFRIVVNTPTTHGSIGLTTGLDPAMTLGCGGYGGNITSDNISPRHLLNIKRLAYETTPARRSRRTSPRQPRPGRRCRRRPPPPPSAGRDRRRRRWRGGSTSSWRRAGTAAAGCSAALQPASPSRSTRPLGTEPGRTDGAVSDRPTPSIEKPADFVCEDDVRQAVRQGRKIVIGERTIVTPAARDLGEQHRVFVQAGWPR